MGKHILPAGWDNWRNPDNERTARYMEYGNYGEGANTAQRVAWSRQLSKKEADSLLSSSPWGDKRGAAVR